MVLLRRSLVLLVTALLLSGAAAGCLGEPEPKPATPVKKNARPTPPSTPDPAKAESPEERAEINQSLGKRWHFHNYWGTSPNLTLFSGEVSLGVENPTVSAVPTKVLVGSVTFGLPYGTVVPPETGTITVKTTFEESPALTGLNVSYRPANVDEFLPAGQTASAGAVEIAVGPDMTDVPHRGRSVWQFRLIAAPNDQGVGAANGTVQVEIVATIGRPIFIDPPHIDHWKGTDTVPVLAAEAEVHAAKPPADGLGYVSLTAAPSASRRPTMLEFPVVGGGVVPEGTRVLLARLAWDSPVPPQVANPALTYLEENSGSEDAPMPVSDKPGERIYKITLAPYQTDTPYTNQSLWTFRVVLDGAGGGFSGTVTLDVWATRLDGDAAIPTGRAEVAEE